MSDKEPGLEATTQGSGELPKPYHKSLRMYIATEDRFIDLTEHSLAPDNLPVASSKLAARQRAAAIRTTAVDAAGSRPLCGATTP